MPLFPAFLLMLTLSLLSVVLPRPVLAWEFAQRGDGSGPDQALAVALGGNVFAAGQLSGDIFAVKLQRNHGDVQWRYQAGTPSGFELARAATVDHDGHLIVAGRDGGSMAVSKIDKDSGAAHWTALMEGGDAFAVGVDGVGDVIAAGTLGINMVIVKFRGTDGVELWRAVPSNANPGGQVRALAVDRSGNAVVAGFLSVGRPPRPNFAVLKLNGADGSVLWNFQVPSHEFSGGDGARGVAVDTGGDVVAVGVIRVMTDPNTLSSKFSVVKVAGATGSLLWRHDVDGNARSFDDGNAVVLDGAGDVVASGNIGGELGVIKLAGVDGAEQWRHTGGPNPLPGKSVDVDRDGNVVAATRNIVMKLFGATGVEVWQQTLTTMSLSREVAFDNSGNVVVVGEGPGGFVAVKRNGSDGSDF